MERFGLGEQGGSLFFWKRRAGVEHRAVFFCSSFQCLPFVLFLIYFFEINLINILSPLFHLSWVQFYSRSLSPFVRYSVLKRLTFKHYQTLLLLLCDVYSPPTPFSLYLLDLHHIFSTFLIFLYDFRPVFLPCYFVDKKTSVFILFSHTFPTLIVLSHSFSLHRLTPPYKVAQKGNA